MKAKHEIISQENIKPSLPTPLDKKTYKLSLFDQIVPPIYVPIVLYYPNLERKNSCNKIQSTDNHQHERISRTTQRLNQSLSSTLSRFYPLAGRIKDALTIDCSDQGALFVVAKHSTDLSDFLKKPDPLACRDHIPHELTWAEPGPGSYVAKVQVNFFACGGIAIGTLIFHKVADGATLGSFMKAWAGSNAGPGRDFYPDYRIATLYPPIESMQRESHLFSAVRQYFKIGKTTLRCFVFDSLAISKIRDEISPGARCTRVEAVSALMWKWFITASARSKNGQGQPITSSLVTHSVNMRRKSDPPLPETSFGNLVWIVPASVEIDDDPDLRHLMMKVRESIRRVDSGFVKKMQGDGGLSGYYGNLEESRKGFPENADFLAISSWCNFGLYGVDFGWGRPVWISRCDGGSDGDEEELPYLNALWLMDTREGDGVEAWLTLGEEYMSVLFDDVFEQEMKDLLARVDPCPMV